MTTFGVDFQRHLEDSNTEENVPHIISACIDEIDKRGKRHNCFTLFLLVCM